MFKNLIVLFLQLNNVYKTIVKRYKTRKAEKKRIYDEKIAIIKQKVKVITDLEDYYYNIVEDAYMDVYMEWRRLKLRTKLFNGFVRTSWFFIMYSYLTLFHEELFSKPPNHIQKYYVWRYLLPIWKNYFFLSIRIVQKTTFLIFVHHWPWIQPIAFAILGYLIILYIIKIND